MGYRTIETATTKDGAVADVVFRWPTENDAKKRVWAFMNSQGANENVTYAQAIIIDDRGAVYKNEEYIVPVEPPTPEE